MRSIQLPRRAAVLVEEALGGELVASAVGECLDRITLATAAVLARSDVGRRRAVPFSWLAFDPIGFLVLQICRIPSPGFAARRFLRTRARRGIRVSSGRLIAGLSNDRTRS